ncbi:MAG: rhomboid family intramembrane serine protease [Anaerolineales bacterium]|nr:rhomboid family intramembrane serine protease [Anaerolineales bacterium]
MNQTPASSPDPFIERPPEPAQPRQQYVVRLPSQPPTMTYALIGVTVFFYILQMIASAFFPLSAYGIDQVTSLGARISQNIYNGELWRLITPIFLHGSIPHIFFNMYALLSIGTLIERHFGRTRFLLLYFLAGFSGNVLSFLFTQGYSVGASTSIFGLIAAEAILFYQNRKLFGSHARQAIGNAVFIIAINLFLGLAPSIDNWGHIGGLIGGAIFAWFAAPKWITVGMPPEFSLQDERESREVSIGVALVLLIFGGLTAWALMFGG